MARFAAGRLNNQSNKDINRNESIAFTASCRNTYFKSYSRQARNIIVIMAVPAWYVFFLVVLVVAAMT